MPWKESSVMEERLRFVARLLEGEPMSELCREFGISRKTGYKIFVRYKEQVVLADHQREAAIGAAENIAGVKAVRSHLAWVEPISGMVFDDPSDEAVSKKAVASEPV